MSASARRYPPIGMDGESFFLRQWLKPYAEWIARGLMAGQFNPRICRARLVEIAEAMATRAKFPKPASAYLDADSIILEEIDRLQAKLDRLCADIQAEIRPMIHARAPRNWILAAAHDANGRAGFLIDEQCIEPIVAEVVREIVEPPSLDWRYRRAG